MFMSSKWKFYKIRKEIRSHKEKWDFTSPCNRECSRKKMTIMTKVLIQSYRMAHPENKGTHIYQTYIKHMDFSFVSVFRCRMLYYNGQKTTLQPGIIKVASKMFLNVRVMLFFSFFNVLVFPTWRQILYQTKSFTFFRLYSVRLVILVAK